MNRSQLEHIIRAASRISGDAEIVVIGSQAIHARPERLPPIAFQSMEADVYPRNHPERADEIDGAIGELSDFHQTFGYYAQGVSPQTAILPAGWERRLIPLRSPNTEGATGPCLDVHDLALSKYAAGREKDVEFNRELVRHGIVSRRTLTRRVATLPIDDERKRLYPRPHHGRFPPCQSAPARPEADPLTPTGGGCPGISRCLPVAPETRARPRHRDRRR